MPRPSPPPWSPKRLTPPSRREHSNSFPRPTRSHAHRCSHLTRQHGGEQSGLVTLTFDLLTLKMMSEFRVTWATSAPISVFLGLSVLDLGPMHARDRQTTDVRQRHRFMPRLLGAGHNKLVSVTAASGYVSVTFMTFDKQSNARNTPVELKSNLSH